MIREMALLLGEGVGAREELRPPDKPSAGGNAEDDRRMLRQVGDMGGVRGDTRCPGQHQASTARRKFNSGLSCQRTPHVGPFERFGHGFVEILNKG
jgi:hypothetical protein